jgi:hypothetical protein
MIGIKINLNQKCGRSIMKLDEIIQPWLDDEDVDDLIIDHEEEEDVVIDLYPFEEIDENVFIDENGGITAEGYNLLATMDASGAFV